MGWRIWIKEPIADPSLTDLSAKISRDLKEKTEHMERVVRKREYRWRSHQWEKKYDFNDQKQKPKGVA